MGDYFQSANFPTKCFSTHEKRASRSEGGAKVAPIKNFKDTQHENMTVAHL